jgi:hypothetical protein
VYMPKINHDNGEIEKLYEEISETLHQEGRGQVNAIVMGDFNSIVGEGFKDKEIGEARCSSTSASNMIL